MSQVTLTLLALCVFSIGLSMAAPQLGSGISFPTEFPSGLNNGLSNFGSGSKLPSQFDYHSMMRYQEQLAKFMQQYGSNINIDNFQ